MKNITLSTFRWANLAGIRRQSSRGFAYLGSGHLAAKQQEAAIQSGPALEAPRAVTADAQLPNGLFYSNVNEPVS